VSSIFEEESIAFQEDMSLLTYVPGAFIPPSALSLTKEIPLYILRAHFHLDLSGEEAVVYFFISPFLIQGFPECFINEKSKRAC
jgi:hypothetical protein